MHYVLSVSEINRYIKGIISRDLVLSNLWIRGEISNYKYHYSGHMYFTLKDASSLLKCVMFKTQNSGLKFVPDNGMKVIIKGYVSVFERDGQYQLYAEEMQPDGIGSLHLAFEQLKRKLQEEGLFDEQYKKELPYLPGAIGVVTSSTGAVIRDIINIVGRRFKNTEIKVFPVAVQGETASRQIAGAIRKLNEMKCVDVIIVARGGGSLEELWAFNEEIVARGIFESKIPVISAVGHETDYTIADFVADVRAPTPSAAAELVVPEKAALEGRIAALNSRLKSFMQKELALSKARVQRLKGSIVFKQPYDRIYQERMQLEQLNKYIMKGLQLNRENVRKKLHYLVGKLDALSPLSILARGFSVASLERNGALVRRIGDVKPGDRLEVRVQDGRIYCTVNGAEAEDNSEGKEKKL